MSGLAPILALAAVALGGEALVELFWRERTPGERGLARALALLAGLGAWSTAYAAVLLAGRATPVALLAKDAALALGGAAVLFAGRRRRAPGGRAPVGDGPRPAPGSAMGGGRAPEADDPRRAPATATPRAPAPRAGAPAHLVWLFAAAALAAALVVGALSLAEPEGAGDSWCVWNLHARFLYRDPAGVPHALRGLSYWTHPDYPLLLPGLVAEGWRVASGETVAVPAAVAAAFIGLATAVLVLGVARLRGAASGLTAGLVLLGTPMFLLIGTAQIADAPVAAFVLAAAVLIAIELETRRRPRGGSLALAGVFAALAASTKNEGMVFLLAFAAILPLVASAPAGAKDPGGEPGPGGRPGRRERARVLVAYALGALPALIVLQIFKRSWAPANDLFRDLTPIAALSRLTPRRLGAVAGALLDEPYAVHKWNGFFAALPLAALALRGPRRGRRSRAAVGGALGLVLLGFVAIYALTPYDPRWHVTSSFGRLLVQCWPTALLATFLALPPLRTGRTHERLVAKIP